MPIERSPRRLSSNVRDKDEDQNRRRRLQDSAPLEPSSNSDSKAEAKTASSISVRKDNERGEKTDPASVPRSRSHFQHDGRGSTAHDGRRSGRRMTPERRKWNSREEDRAKHRMAVSGPSEKEKPGARAGDSHVSRHDMVSEVDKKIDPPAKRRRQFREEKLPPESKPVGKAVPERSKDSNALNTTIDDGRQEERDRRRHPLERSDYGRAYVYGRARPFSNGERVQRTDLPPRDRFNGGENDNRFKGRDEFSGRQGYPSSAGREEKWKHDLYDETNISPAKNEDDPVAKVEALLSL